MIRSFVSIGLMTMMLWGWGSALCRSQLDAPPMSPRTLLIAARDIMRHDDLARRIFARQDSLAVVVSDTTICLNLFLADMDRVVDALYPDRQGDALLYDSLKSMEYGRPRCRGGFDPALQGLSTTSDSIATIIFHALDSTLRFPYYVAIASLVKNRRVRYDEWGKILQQDAGIWYLMIFDRRGHAVWVWSAEAETEP